MMDFKIAFPGVSAGNSAPATPNRPQLRALAAVVDRLRAAWRRRSRISLITRELGLLSDRSLDDIGIPRHDIARFARETADRRG